MLEYQFDEERVLDGVMKSRFQPSHLQYCSIPQKAPSLQAAGKKRSDSNLRKVEWQVVFCRLALTKWEIYVYAYGVPTGTIVSKSLEVQDPPKR